MKKTISIIISILIIIGLMVVGLLSIIDEEQQISGDSLKFKEEYELLNGKYYEEYDLTLSSMAIATDNPMIYINENEIINKLTEGTHIIYLGFPECEWSRKALPVLLNFAKKNKIRTIYYYNFSTIISDYEKGKNEEKVNLYKEIVNILKDNIDNTYEDGTKKLTAPMVVFIKDGEITGNHYKLVESYEDYKLDLTKEQTEELFNIYQRNYNLMVANRCEDC